MAYFSGKPIGTVDALRHVGSMAKMLSVPLRIEIVTTLSVRDMGVQMFRDQRGGGSISRIVDNFRELQRGGWLASAGTKTGGRRRGGVERLYRAVQWPLFDSSTWPVLPQVMREFYSAGALVSLAEEVKGALAAGTMDARAGHCLTCLPCVGDRRAWWHILGRVDNLFGFVLEEAKSADSRLGQSGEKPIPVMTAFAMFESPRDPLAPRHLLELCANSDTFPVSMHQFSLHIAKAIVDPLHILILAELGARPMSVKRFYEEFGGGEITKNRVYRAFRVLRDLGWLRLVDKTGADGRRGGREKLFRAARPQIFAGKSWPTLPAPFAGRNSGAEFEAFARRVRDAIEVGTMEAQTDRHFTWVRPVVDQLGWDRIVEQINAVLDFTHEELKQAEARLAESGEEPIPMTIALAAFEAPPAATLH